MFVSVIFHWLKGSATLKSASFAVKITFSLRRLRRATADEFNVVHVTLTTPLLKFRAISDKATQSVLIYVNIGPRIASKYGSI